MAADATRGGGHLLLWAGVVLFVLAMLSAMSVAVETFGTQQQSEPGSSHEPPSLVIDVPAFYSEPFSET